MKIINQIKTNKLLHLKLIKNKVYHKFNKILLQFKKNFKIFFKFTILNKKILFVGIIKKFQNFILSFIKNTKHSFLQNNFWFNGILTNSNAFLKYLILLENMNLFIKYLFNLNKINLISVFGFKISKISELSHFKIPILGFDNLNSSIFSYKFNFSEKKFNSALFYFFLNVLKIKTKISNNKNGSL
jgi:hypothetical protein